MTQERDRAMKRLSTRLATTERNDLIGMLSFIRARLDDAGELLAAVHISHALDCLDPDDPINQNENSARAVRTASTDAEAMG